MMEKMKMIKKRKVICGIKEYDRKPRKSHSEIFFHCIAYTLIFDSYENFENYRQGIALENADQSRKTAKLIEWWWWYDQA